MSEAARIYLDYNATAPLRPAAAQAMLRAFETFGNPSSVHREGRVARAAVERAREQVAALVGADPAGVIFTSGGSEANNLVLRPGFARLSTKTAPGCLLVGAGEHASVLEGHGFGTCERIPLDADGVVDLAWLAARLDVLGEPALVSIQLANNETGVIQPVAEAARIVHARGGLIHTDAVQAAGKIAMDVAALGVDALTLSAHKIGGPQGVGALVLARDDYALEAMVRGGRQERGRRAGTENVAAIAGFGAAAAEAVRDLLEEGERLAGLRDAFEATLLRFLPEVAIFGERVERLPNTVAFAVEGARAETAMIAFDLAGVALSSGSACSSGKVRRSHVLDAMGVRPTLAEGALRLSFGWATTSDDVIRFAAACEKAAPSMSSGRAHAA